MIECGDKCFENVGIEMMKGYQTWEDMLFFGQLFACT
jgi:hypothetical protein